MLRLRFWGGIGLISLVAACGSDKAAGPGGGHDSGVEQDSGMTQDAGPADAGHEVDAGPPCATTPTYAQIRDGIFVKRCSEGYCHGGSMGGPPGPPRPKGDISLNATSTPANLVNVPYPQDHSVLIVVPGDPRASLLMRKLTNDLPADMSLGAPMPTGEAILWQEIPADEVEQVRCWIRGGAK